MELKFDKRVLTCLEPVLRDTRNDEETLEIRLPEGMPDVGKILASWGQPILRSKEWNPDRISFSGGMMVWVMYLPEQETAPRCLEGWIPYSMSWDLPPETGEGRLWIDLLTRFVDARAVSARKIMIRSGMSASVQAWTSGEHSLPVPPTEPKELELLKNKYPMRLIREAGEKAFSIGEKLTLPGSAPKPDKLMCWMLSPVVTEKKIVANKLVLRGNGNLHILYMSEEGQLHSWDFPLAFSQYAQLDGSYGPTGSGEVILCATALEAETDPDGALEVKCAITAQYVISEQELVELAEDAYAPGRAVQLDRQKLSLPVILDSWEDTLEAERAVSGQMDVAVDTWTTLDRPRQRVQDGRIQLEFPGQLQLLSYGTEGIPTSGGGRFEGKMTVDAEESCHLLIQPGEIQEPQLLMSSDQVKANIRIPVRFTAMGTTELEAVCGAELEQKREAEQDGPSLIIRRVGKQGLWEIAKQTGSTVDAIRKANNLAEDPGMGQLLLIPVR